MGRVILIVDDDEDMRDAYKDALELAGFRTRSAADGVAALDALHADDGIGLILLDLMMPGMNGWQLHEALQSDARLQRIPVVVVTAGDATLPGASANLSKVAELHELLAVVRRHLG